MTTKNRLEIFRHMKVHVCLTVRAHAMKSLGYGIARAKMLYTQRHNDRYMIKN